MMFVVSDHFSRFSYLAIKLAPQLRYVLRPRFLRPSSPSFLSLLDFLHTVTSSLLLRELRPLASLYILQFVPLTMNPTANRFPGLTLSTIIAWTLQRARGALPVYQPFFLGVLRSPDFPPLFPYAV